MERERTSVGLDVHARSVLAYGVDGDTGEVFKARLCPEHEAVWGWLQQLPGPVGVVYEAGPTGFGLARFLRGRGVRCEVAAPSKLHRPCGDRVKTDARDAMLLARLLRLGEIVPVAVPSVAQEAARDLVRAREDVRGDLMRARHRVSKLLLRQGVVWSGGTAWTAAHHQWLRRHSFDSKPLTVAYDSALEAVLLAAGRRDRLDKAIVELAADPAWAPTVAGRAAAARPAAAGCTGSGSEASCRACGILSVDVPRVAVVLKHFLYLDAAALTEYLSALEGGLRDEVQRRHRSAGKGEGALEVKVAKAGGERSHEDEESFRLSDTPQSRFDRLLGLAQADPDLSGWVEVMDADTDLKDVGLGAMISTECDIYIPDAVKAFSSSGDLVQALDLFERLAPFARALGLDTTTGIPPKAEREAVKGFVESVGGNLVAVGELEDSAWRVVGELDSQHLRDKDLEGGVRVVGKVARTWGAGQWRPLLALPGSTLLPRKERRALEQQQPQSDQEDQYLEGPAVLLRVLAIYR